MTATADTILLGAEIVTLASGAPNAQALAIRQRPHRRCRG